MPSEPGETKANKLARAEELAVKAGRYALYAKELEYESEMLFILAYGMPDDAEG